MTRIIEPNYPPTTLATVEDHLACRDAIALSIAKWSKGEAAPDDVKIPIDLLLTNQPRGSLSKARLLLEGPHAGDVAITIKDRNERSLEGAAFFVLSSLALLDPSALHLNETSKDETKRLDYLKVFTQTGAGITAIRILADAQAGEMVMQRQTGDHHDLSASNLVVAPGNRLIQRGRREALAQALKAYDKNAKDWGLSNHLSRWEYQRLIRDSFRFYDIKHAHRFLRVIGEPDAA